MGLNHQLAIKLLALNDISPTLNKLIKSFDQLLNTTKGVNGLIKSTNRSLEKTDALLKNSASLVSIFNQRLMNTGSTLRNTSTAFTAFSSKVNYGFSEATMGAMRFNSALQSTVSLTHEVAANSAAMRFAGGGGGGRKSGGGRSGGGHGYGGHSLTPFLISRSGAATGAIVAGYAAYHLGKESYLAQSDYQMAQQNLGNQGFDNVSAARISNDILANKLARIAGVSNIGMIESVADAGVITRNLDLAEKIAPILAKQQFANETMYKMSRSDEQNLAKFTEMRVGEGITDPAKIAHTLNFSQQMLTTEGGRLKPFDLAAFGRRAQGGILGLSDTGLAHFEPMIQQMGGATTGSALRVFLSQMVGMHMSHQSMDALVKAGVIDPKKVHYDSTGRLLKIDPGAVDNESLMLTDTVKWINTTLKTDLDKAGITTPEARAAWINTAYVNRSNMLVSQALAMWDKSQEQAALIPQAADIDKTYTSSLNLNSGQVQLFSNSLKDFQTALGRFLSPGINKSMQTISTFLEGMANILNRISNFNENSPLANFVNNAVKKQNDNLFNQGSGEGFFERSSKKLEAVIHNHIHLDGRQVAKSVGKHMAEASNNASGITTFNPNMSPIPTNYSSF